VKLPSQNSTVATAAARLRIFLQASESVGRARPIYTRPAWPTHKGWTAGIVSAKNAQPGQWPALQSQRKKLRKRTAADARMEPGLKPRLPRCPGCLCSQGSCTTTSCCHLCDQLAAGAGGCHSTRLASRSPGQHCRPGRGQPDRMWEQGTTENVISINH
jgi:hypothetical protein